MVTPVAKREAVARLQAPLRINERRACRFIGADRKSVRDPSRRDDDADLQPTLPELAQERRRFGYRWLHILLRLEDVVIKRNKTQRHYSEQKLAVR